MGWCGRSRPFDGSKKTFVQELYTYDHETHKGRIEDISIRGNVAYGICFETDKKTGIESHEALVIMLDCKGSEWYYKTCGESCGPYHHDAPKALLDRLDALGEPPWEFAKEWREECRKQLAKKKSAPKLQNGDQVQFTKPLNFTYFEESVFKVEMRGRSGTAVAFRASNGTLCRIPKWRGRDFVLLGHAAEQ